MIDDAKVLFSFAPDFAGRVVPEAETNLEEETDCRRANREMKQMAIWCNDARQLPYSIGQRHIFQGSRGDDEIKRIIGKGQRQNISLGVVDLPRSTITLVDGLAGGDD